MASEDKAPWWVDFLKTVGIPTALLLGLSYAGFEAVRWYANEVLKPQVETTKKQLESQKEYIDKASRFIDTLNNEQELSKVVNRGAAEHQVEMLRITTGIAAVTEDTNTTVKIAAEKAAREADAAKASSEKMLQVLRSIEENTKPIHKGMP